MSELPEVEVLEAFRARRAYAVLSEGWLSQVQKARRLLRFHRVRTGRLDRRHTVPKDQLTAEDIGGPWRPLADYRSESKASHEFRHFLDVGAGGFGKHPGAVR
jgi:hypothetical protein